VHSACPPEDVCATLARDVKIDITHGVHTVSPVKVAAVGSYETFGKLIVRKLGFVLERLCCR
jgi:hypothetical protein